MSGLLIHEEFVAYFPALGRALGSVEDAVLIQALWFRRDRETNCTTATIAELADAVGMTERTARRRLAKLADCGVLTKGRAGSYDATTVWSVHLDRIRENTDMANMATSNRHNTRHDAANLAGSDAANMATSDVANLAGSTYLQELEEDNKNVGVPADAETRRERTPDSILEEMPERPEISQLCELLADAVEANGSKRPSITKRWRDAARLMIDRDGRTPADIAAAINWSQRDSFWRSNILSMPKLREKFDTLRLQAERSGTGTGRDRQADILASEMQAARAADSMQQQRSPFGVIGR